MLNVLTVQVVPRVFKNSGWCTRGFFLNLAETFTHLFCPVNCCHLSCLIALCLNHIHSLFLVYLHNIISCYSYTNQILQRKQTPKKLKQKSKIPTPHPKITSSPLLRLVERGKPEKDLEWESSKPDHIRMYFRNSIDIH